MVYRRTTFLMNIFKILSILKLIKELRQDGDFSLEDLVEVLQFVIGKQKQ